MSDYLTDDLPVEEGGFVVRITSGDGFAWGETIAGTVTVFPAKAETISFSRVTVSVIEQDEDGFTTPTPFGGIGLSTEIGTTEAFPIEIPYHAVVIAEDITLAPGDAERDIPFTLMVPMGIALTAVCFVAAHAASTAGIDSDRHAAAGFTLLPPRFIQAATNALLTFGDFEQIEQADSPKAEGSGYVFTLDFIAPPSLHHALDGVKFELEEDGAQVIGTIVINPQEHTLADHLRSFIHADRIRVPVAFDRAELETAGNEGIASEAVKQRLHELLDPFLHSA